MIFPGELPPGRCYHADATAAHVAPNPTLYPNHNPMKKTTLLALAMIGPFAFLTPAQAGEKASTSTSARTDLAKVFDGKLTDAEGKPVKSENLAKAKYVAVYFSAHWCPPCRKFTPELVKFVNENRKNGNFEVVLVSSDQDAKHMQEYMSGAKMPWAGTLGQNADLGSVGEGVPGIPHLRVFDSSGKVVIDTDYNKQVYPTVVLTKIKSLIDTK